MSRRKIVPVDRERPFELEELFFSTTDRKGVITSGNDVFLRVSGLDRDELVGHAHNVVRHPDMPRAVFHLFWEYLLSGRPIAAYVKNIAADGSFYWVMASAVPVGDGFVSIRLKPTSAYFDQVKRIYTEVRALERRIEGDDPKMRKPALEAGLVRLQELLAGAGYESYDAFMRAALPAEVTARDEVLGMAAHERLATSADAGPSELVRIVEDTARGHEHLDTMVKDLAGYSALSAQLAEKSTFIIALADDMGLFSLNAILVAARLGNDGASLGAVAEILRSNSDRAVPIIENLHGEITHAVAGLGDLSLRVAASKLQAEMVMVFVRELLRDGATADDDVNRDLTALAAGLRDGVTGMLAAFDRLGERMELLMQYVSAMEQTFNIMRALEVNGRIEAARTAAGESVESLFRTIAERVEAARQEMTGFAGVKQLTAGRDQDAERRLARDVSDVGRQVAALAA